MGKLSTGIYFLFLCGQILYSQQQRIEFVHSDLRNDSTVVYHGSRSHRFIALTFDACPAYGKRSFDRQIFQVLVDSQVPATFFLSGTWIKYHLAETRQLAAQKGFELGNHSLTHPHLPSLSPDSVFLELKQNQNLLKRVTGVMPTIFRAPYGEFDEHVVDCGRMLGLRIIQYDLPSGDPDTSFDKIKLIRSVVRSTRNGSIIVMHINGRGWHSAEALPEIIKDLRSRGFLFTTISELLRN